MTHLQTPSYLEYSWWKTLGKVSSLEYSHTSIRVKNQANLEIHVLYNVVMSSKRISLWTPTKPYFDTIPIVWNVIRLHCLHCSLWWAQWRETLPSPSPEPPGLGDGDGWLLRLDHTSHKNVVDWGEWYCQFWLYLYVPLWRVGYSSCLR